MSSLARVRIGVYCLPYFSIAIAILIRVKDAQKSSWKIAVRRWRVRRTRFKFSTTPRGCYNDNYDEALCPSWACLDIKREREKERPLKCKWLFPLPEQLKNVSLNVLPIKFEAIEGSENNDQRKFYRFLMAMILTKVNFFFIKY